MGWWLTCVRNFMEWSKDAVENSMGGGKQMGFLDRGGGVDINWSSPFLGMTTINVLTIY